MAHFDFLNEQRVERRRHFFEKTMDKTQKETKRK
ncbi:hypothetical protein YS9_0649 [Enterococcus sp. C1]|jgi:hypothetical protein|nr:hypothetical protein YS9_0649 [Enterococcus sp. C1]